MNYSKTLLLLACLSSLTAGWEVLHLPPDPTRTAGQLRFPLTSVHLGQVQAGQTASFVFPFSNAGPGPAVLSEVSSSCDCLQTVVARLEYAAGERGLIRCTFDSTDWASTSPVEKTVTVKTFGGSVQTLAMRVRVTP